MKPWRMIPILETHKYRIIEERKINGELGSLCPAEGEPPRFLQLYIYDTDNEVDNRMHHFGGNNSGLRRDIVKGLIELLDNHNALVQLFRTSREKFLESKVSPFKIRLYNVVGAHEYELPTGDMLGAIVYESGSETQMDYDIIIEERLGQPQSSFDGDKRMTMKAYYSYMLHDRVNSFNYLSRTGRLFQQYMVTAFRVVKQIRIDFIREHQNDIRNEYLFGIYDAIMRGDSDGSDCGGRLISPQSFTCGPCYMYAHYLDALAICRVHGNPSFFITFTCNVKWPEITGYMENFLRLTTSEKADTVDRVFEMKIHQFVNRLHSRVSKTGTPHSHTLIWIDKRSHIQNDTDIDAYISAELSSKYSDLECHRIVSEFMMHGPCGLTYPTAPCMQNTPKCMNHFPKEYCSQTYINKDGFVHYRRRDTGIMIVKQNVELDNGYVIPYNKQLCARFFAHINVEYCGWTMLIKYLFKYIFKGTDRIAARVSRTNTVVASSSTQGQLGIHSSDSSSASTKYAACHFPKQRPTTVDHEPIGLWKRVWKIMSEDIPYASFISLGFPNLQIPLAELEGYTLYELEGCLNHCSKSLTDFRLPLPTENLMAVLRHRLLMEEKGYNRELLSRERDRLIPKLNSRQRNIFNLIIEATTNKKQEHGGTGKTFLWKTIIYVLRFEGKIVLIVASSEIAYLLLPAGRTAHSRFKFPLDLNDTFVCSIKKNTHLATLLKETNLIIWDESPMNDRRYFDALDMTLRDILDVPNKLFGGKTVMLGCDFRETLRVKKNASRNEIIKWLLKVGDGSIGVPDESDPENTSWIDIPNTYRIPDDEYGFMNLITFIYDDDTLLHPTAKDFQEKAIVCPKNETTDTINARIMNLLQGSPKRYISNDEATSHGHEGEVELLVMEIASSTDIPLQDKGKMIMAEPEITNISDLSPMHSNITIEVGTPIQANMEIKDAEYFEQLLQLHKAYRFSDFSCEKTDPWEPYNEVVGRATIKQTILIDYIGRIQAVGRLITSGDATTRRTHRRTIVIQNLIGNTTGFTMWNEMALDFDTRQYDSLEKPVIIAIPTGSKHGTSTRDQTPTRRRPRKGKDPESLSSIHSPPHGSTKLPGSQRWPLFTKSIHKNIGTTRNAPPVEKNSEEQPFPKCKDHGPQTIETYSYCFKAIVNDGSATTSITCFSEQANTLTRDCDEVLAEISNKDQYTLPPSIKELEGTTHTFQFHFDIGITARRPNFILDEVFKNPTLALPAPTLTETPEPQTTNEPAGTTPPQPLDP
ncbi:DNA helicase [Tanacetum coccineum]